MPPRRESPTPKARCSASPCAGRGTDCAACQTFHLVGKQQVQAKPASNAPTSLLPSDDPPMQRMSLRGGRCARKRQIASPHNTRTPDSPTAAGEVRCDHLRRALCDDRHATPHLCKPHRSDRASTSQCLHNQSVKTLSVWFRRGPRTFPPAQALRGATRPHEWPASCDRVMKNKETDFLQRCALCFIRLLDNRR